jgi:hypothetical protein
MVRPCRLDTVNFLRKLSNDERAILLASGDGDISDGFQRILAVYRHLHGLGFQHGDSLDSVTLIKNDSHLDLDGEID